MQVWYVGELNFKGNIPCSPTGTLYKKNTIHRCVCVHTGLKLCAHIDVPGCVNFYFLFIKSWLFELPGMDHIVRMVFLFVKIVLWENNTCICIRVCTKASWWNTSCIVPYRYTILFDGKCVSPAFCVIFSFLFH